MKRSGHARSDDRVLLVHSAAPGTSGDQVLDLSRIVGLQELRASVTLW
jgi:hypothetical protein